MDRATNGGEPGETKGDAAGRRQSARVKRAFEGREAHHEAAVQRGQVGVQIACEPGVSHDVLCGAPLRRVGPEDVVDEVLDLRGELHIQEPKMLVISTLGLD